jgi:hypothetical protein
MLKGNKKYIWIFLGMFALVVAVQYLLPKPVSWTRSYTAKDKSPFGCYAIFKLLENVYADTLSTSNQTFYNLKNKVHGNSSVLLVNDQIHLSRPDLEALFEMAEQGNKIFIAANEFNGLMADTFHLETRNDFFYFFSNDSLSFKKGAEIQVCAKNHSDSVYKYSQVAWSSSFTSFDSTRFRIKAVNKEKRACLLSADIGKGKIYLCSFPDLFGNYFTAGHHNRQVPYLLLSALKNSELVWDEYYKSGKIKNDSVLKFIIENDALYSAYLLLFFSILLYMFTEGRRRQKAIPVLEPVTNSTLEFVNVISHVYFNGKNHQRIAREKIKYFYENIRKKFGVNTSEINESFLREVTELSGVDQKLVKQLFIYCEKIRSASEITELDLAELNRQISNFNKNSLR